MQERTAPRRAWSLLVGATLVFAATVLLVSGDAAPRDFDRGALRALRNPDGSPLGPVWVHETMRDFTALGSFPVLALAVLGVGGFLLLRGRRFGAWLVLGAPFGGMLLSSFLKELFDRPRPDVVERLAHVMTLSFPSGHSMHSAVVYLTLAALLTRVVEEPRARAFALVVATLLTFLVGLSRVYLGVHYATDVLGGWAAGIAWAAACWLFAHHLQERGTMRRADEA